MATSSTPLPKIHPWWILACFIIIITIRLALILPARISTSLTTYKDLANSKRLPASDFPHRHGGFPQP
nr:hypothetical protein Iba_chr11bCG12700 [Ipomoea batatas]